MNKYTYTVVIGEIECGEMTIESYNEDFATEMITEKIGKALYKALPNLDIEYYTELRSVTIDKKEIKKRLEKAVAACPSDYEVELNCNDTNGNVYIYKYSEKAGGASPLDGFNSALYNIYEADLDDNFDIHDLWHGYMSM